MSYDLMVFEPSAAPSDRSEFLEWYGQQIEWREEHGYNDPANTTEKLRAWFFEMKKTYPAMNGPYASDDYDNIKITDYCVGQSVIYAAFRWSVAADAYRAVFESAKNFGVGFYDVSAEEGQVWMPEPGGGFGCIHSG